MPLSALLNESNHSQEEYRIEKIENKKNKKLQLTSGFTLDVNSYFLCESSVFVLPPYLPPYVGIIINISFNKLLSLLCTDICRE